MGTPEHWGLTSRFVSHHHTPDQNTGWFVGTSPLLRCVIIFEIRSETSIAGNGILETMKNSRDNAFPEGLAAEEKKSVVVYSP